MKIGLGIVGALYFMAVAAHAVTFETQRQAFAILKDANGATLGAEMQVMAYPDETTYGSIINSGALSTNTPEYMLLKQAKLLSLGDIESVLADFRASDRQLARKIFADPAALRKLYADFNGFRFVCKAKFGPVYRITCDSSMINGHRLTLSAFLSKEGDRYVFITQPAGFELFSFAAAAYPYWKHESERGMSTEDQNGMLSATFNYTQNDEQAPESADTQLVIKYKLTLPAGNGSNLNSLGAFFSKVVQAYKAADTNAIISLWHSGFDQNYIKGMIERGEAAKTVNFLNRFDKYKLDFFIYYSNEYWIFFSPDPVGDAINILRVSKDGNDFTLTRSFDDVFADRIICSEQMSAVFLMQAKQ
jgi:hypothetical protein